LLLARRDPQDPMPAALHRLGQSLAGIPLPPPKPRVTPNTVLNLFMEALAAYLGGEPLAPEQPDRLLRACAPLPLGWFAKELLELHNRLQGQPARPSPLLDLVPQQAPWERALASLRRLGQDHPPAPTENPGKY